MSLFQMLGRSRSTAMTLAPNAISTKKGPMADPAPKRTKYRFERSLHDLFLTTAEMASAASGSMVP